MSDDEGDLFADDSSSDEEEEIVTKKKVLPAAAAAAAAAPVDSDSDDDDDDSDSDDTAELFAKSSSSSNKKPAAAKKKKKAAPPPKPKVIKAAAAAAKKKKDDSDDGQGLFDSSSSDDDSDDDDGGGAKNKKPQSRRERLEALAKKKKRVDEDDKAETKKKAASRKNDNDRKKAASADGDKDKNSGYESAGSMDSADFQRTKEDDDFLDTTGEDADAVQELYAEQHFDDEPEDMEDNSGERSKKKRRYGSSSGSREDYGRADGPESDNPIMQAVQRMKKKKREKKTQTEMEDECREFLTRMELAAEQDEKSVAERKPATRKLAMLQEVVDMLTRKDYQGPLLELDVLVVCKRWIQPLPNGTLGNVTVRARLLSVIADMQDISKHDLMRSEFGKVVMVLYKHPKETPPLKRQCKSLVEQWSRSIFSKSGNMRDLERVSHSRGEGTGGLASIRRQQAQAEAQRAQMQRPRAAVGGGPAANNKDLQSIIASGKKGGDNGPASVNRARVPFSKGFAYSVRPTAKTEGSSSQPGSAGSKGVGPPPAANKDGNRGKLSKRMLEKSRAVSKNQRSANISVEGRRTKG